MSDSVGVVTVGGGFAALAIAAFQSLARIFDEQCSFRANQTAKSRVDGILIHELFFSMDNCHSSG
jgi:hypothetical protein